MRITLSLLAISALLFSLPSIAQRYWAPGFDEDLELFESGGGIAEGGICMHITSMVDGVPMLRNFEPNFNDLALNELIVEILADSHEQRIVQAARIALEKYGFVQVEDNVYELPDSSLCFLKMYRSESPTKMLTFIPFFKNPLDRCDAVFSAQYNPIAFEQTLIQEFAQFELTGYTELSRTIYLIHPTIRMDVDTCD